MIAREREIETERGKEKKERTIKREGVGKMNANKLAQIIVWLYFRFYVENFECRGKNANTETPVHKINY